MIATERGGRQLKRIAITRTSRRLKLSKEEGTDWSVLLVYAAVIILVIVAALPLADQVVAAYRALYVIGK